MRERKTVSVSLPIKLIEWIDDVVKSDFHYRDRSQFIEICIMERKEKLKTSKNL